MRGSVAAGRGLLPLLTVRGGLSVAPHTPQAAPHPSWLPLSREWDRLSARSEVSIQMCLML